MFKQHGGSVPVDFIVFDMKDKIKLNLHSRSVKVKVTNEFLKILEEKKLRFKLN
ncbi:hypothetical protein MHL31_13785 [Lutibacter sp. A80]|nr:hypothetical protein [Lutibacter sp. A80]UMB60143.1 hypothetical protein MHL31_13785 [Lutibacter sp. A80]